MAATAASCIALGVRIIAAYTMVYAFSVGYEACWENLVFGWSAALIFDLSYYASGRWKTKSLIKKNQEVKI